MCIFGTTLETQRDVDNTKTENCSRSNIFKLGFWTRVLFVNSSIRLKFHSLFFPINLQLQNPFVCFNITTTRRGCNVTMMFFQSIHPPLRFYNFIFLNFKKYKYFQRFFVLNQTEREAKYSLKRGTRQLENPRKFENLQKRSSRDANIKIKI